nr:transporter [Ruegeria sp. Ofav3-42]
MIALLFSLSALAPIKAAAVEGGSGIYLLGSKGSGAGILPPTGKYFLNDSYYYSGLASASTALPDEAGTLAFGLDADAFVNLSTFLNVTDTQVLGGRLAYGVVVPVVAKDVSASATASFGGSPISGAVSDDTFAFGDPLLTGIIGWSSGNWHSTMNVLLNIPVGSYSPNSLANAGFNRWGLDTTLAVTWLDPATGYEVSVAPGFTFNGENDDTGYRSGTEFHLEFAAMKHQSKQFAYGLNGYYYHQITGDSGTAPGDFKGRVGAIGPALNYTFLAGNTPVTLKAKYLHEFDADNRLEGGSALIQLAIPLGL